MKKQTEQEQLNVFQQYLQGRVTEAIANPNNENGPSQEMLPYYHEIQNASSARKMLKNLSDLNNPAVFLAKQSLEALIPEEIDHMANLNEGCREYGYRLIHSANNIMNAIGQDKLPARVQQKNRNSAREELTKISKKNIRSDNLENLIESVKDVNETYLYGIWSRDSRNPPLGGNAYGRLK